MWKKILAISVLSLFIGMSAQAQFTSEEDRNLFDEGTRMVGGTASLTVISYSGKSLTQLVMAPNVVRFFAPNHGVGADAAIAITTEGKISIASLAIGPKYLLGFGELEKTVLPYLGVGVSLLSESITIESDGYSSNSQTATKTGYRFKGAFGLMVKLNQHLGVPIELGFTYDKIESSKQTTISIAAGLAGFLF